MISLLARAPIDSGGFASPQAPRRCHQRRLQVEQLEDRMAPALFAANLSLGDLNGTNGFHIDGIANHDYSGFSVSDAGDVNGDGIDDLIIGAPSANAGGQAYVVFGHAGPFAASLKLSGLNGTNGFILNGDYGAGISVSGAGDVNGDGFDDVIVGDPFVYPGVYPFAGRGQAYVVFGHSGTFAGTLDLSSLNGSNGFTLNGIAVGDEVGRRVNGAGDINGDGFDDLLIGTTRSGGPNGSYPGQAYLVFGHSGAFAASLDLSSLNGSNGFTVNGIAAADSAANAVSGAGDVNGDGFDDLLIGAFRANSGGGGAYLVFGHSGAFAASLDLSNLNGTNGFTLNGNSDYAGASVSGAGDVNGDGFDDLLVGATLANAGGTDRGGAYLVFGHSGSFAASLDLSSLNGTNGFILNGIGDYDYSGNAVSGAGDVNGDGFDDLLVGASLADAGGYSRGQAYVVFGHSGSFAASLDLSSLNGSNGFTLNGIANSDLAGDAVSGAGDVNGDGVDDLVAGAWQANAGGTDRGQSYVVFGRTQLIIPGTATVTGTDTGTPEVAVYDSASGDELARFLAFPSRGGGVRVAAGDVSGDGNPDIIVGAGPGRQSFVYVFGVLDQFRAFGKSYKGGVFVAAGNIDGDPFADIIVGKGKGSPKVKVYSGFDGSLLGSFKGYPLSAGARVAAADIDTNVGFDEIIVGTGAGVAGRVHIFSFINGTAALVRSFKPFGNSYQGGVFVAAGDIDSGTAEILVGRGKGTTLVSLFDANGAELASLPEAYAGFTGGVRVGMTDSDDDGIIDQLLTAPGPGHPPEVGRFDTDLNPIDSFFAYDPAFTGGVFVAGG